MSHPPIVMISSYPPRLCGIATFCEEAREFVQKKHPEREVLVISHSDGKGEGVFPLIDLTRRNWWKPVAEKVKELNPWAVHIQHEYGLYEYHDERGFGDNNRGFLELLSAIGDWPLVLEPHTVHGRLRDDEAEFIFEALNRTHIMLLKCNYQKWRLEWSFQGRDWPLPRNLMIVPHGARSDKRWSLEHTPILRKELGLDKIKHLSNHLVGLVGWIQSNKRWDILTSVWEEIHDEVYERTGVDWDLFAAGEWRDPNHLKDYTKYRADLKVLENKGLAHFFEFIPRGEDYYKVMAVCDFIVLPSVDETQSGTLARIIALNKPFVTTAPLEGLTSQTLESKGGLLFTNKPMLKEVVIRLACDEGLRMSLGFNLKNYLENVVAWEVVADQYDEAYHLAQDVINNHKKVELPSEF